MALWFVLSLMTATATFAVLWPLFRRPKKNADASDVLVYRDQLTEIDRDLAAGQIEQTEAAAAKTEVARRLIAASDVLRVQAAPAEQNWFRRAVALSVLILLPLGAGGLYLGLGSPTLPEQPVGLRAAASPDQSIDRLVAQVEQHLAGHPDDGRGWEIIAPVYLRMGRFEDGVKARRNALRLNGESADRVASLGEALMLAADGVVTAEAKGEFERAIRLEDSHVMARYYLGIAAEQEGDKARAATIWRALLASAPPDAAWRPFVQAAMDRVEGRSVVSGPASGSSSQLVPTQEQIAAASNIPAEQRNAMVLGMVERLSERLHRNGGDPEGWVQLVRSYLVLGKPEAAQAAALDARRALAAEPEKLRRLEELLAALDKPNEPSPGPSQEQIAAATQIPAEQRDAMVLGMVERLSERLRREGGDPEGWARLVRSYLVLGKPQNAQAAALDGRRALGGDPEKLRRLNELLKDLGIEG